MAELIPSTFPFTLDDPKMKKEGFQREFEVYTKLGSAYDEKVHVMCKPTFLRRNTYGNIAGGEYADFMIVHPQRGIIFLECKAGLMSYNATKELEERKVSGATSIYEIKHKDKTIAWGVGWHSWCYKHKAWEEVEFTAFRLYVPYLKNGEIIIQNKLISLKINQIYDALIDGDTLILADGINIYGNSGASNYYYHGASFFEIDRKNGINFDLSFDELKEKINIYKLSPALIISTLSWYNQISALEKYTKENFDEIYEDLNTNYWWNVYEGWRDNDIYELILEKYENYKARITDEEIKNIKKNCLSKNNYNNIYELVRNCYFWHSSWVHSSWAIGSKARAGAAEKKCIEGDCRNGNGTYTFANGDKYVGEFKDGKYHGQGTYTKSDGTVEKGIWESGKLFEPTTPKPKSG